MIWFCHFEVVRLLLIDLRTLLLQMFPLSFDRLTDCGESSLGVGCRCRLRLPLPTFSRCVLLQAVVQDMAIAFVAQLIQQLVLKQGAL